MGTLTKSLGTDVNSPVSAVAPSSKFFQEELMPSMEQMQTSLGVEEKFKKEKSVQEAQQQADILRKDVTLAEEENKKLREDPIRAKYQAAIDQKESAAYIPDQENPERLATILALTNLMGVAIGHGGKTNAQTALAAQNGMLEGYQKGRADIIKQQKDIFDENQKKLDKTIDDLHRGMQDAAILYAKDKEAGHQKAMLTMAENQASFMKDFYDKNGMGQTYEMSKQIYEMKNKKYEEMKKEEAKNTITPYQQKTLDIREQELAQRREHQKRMESFTERGLGLRERGMDAKVTAEERKELLKLDPSIRNRLTQYPNIDVKSIIGIKPANQTKVVNSLESVEKIESIGNFIRSNPDAVGFLANLANQTNINTIDSLASWEKMVDSNPNMPETAKTLNKMLTTQAYRDVAATGQRPTVYLDRVFKDLYSQNSSPTSLLSILKERQKDADTVLSEYKMELKNNENYDNFELFREDPREYMKSAMFVAPDGSQVSALDVEDTAKKRKINFAKVVRDLKLKPTGAQ